MKYQIASAFLRRGMTLGSQAPEASVRDLIHRMHPKVPARPLRRIGGEHDGGYLVPYDLDGIVACFSPGVGAVATFEEAMIARGIPCFLADGSVSAAPIAHRLVHFDPVYIGVLDAGAVTTLDAWVGRHAPTSGDLLLQMDIEGSEWPVLINASEATLRRFRIIVLEMHDLDRLIDKVGFTLIGSALGRLLQDFVVVHLHPNNEGGMVTKRDLALPRVVEATFLRKDRVFLDDRATRFPHPLDAPNDPRLPDVILPPIWHAH